MLEALIVLVVALAALGTDHPGLAMLAVCVAILMLLVSLIRGEARI